MARKQASSKSKEPPAEKVVRATNRRARRNYVINETIEAGLILLGSEVKSLRVATPTLSDGYARFRGDKLLLFGVYIKPLPQASYFNHEPERPRECLLKKRELRKLKHGLEAKGMTCVALSLYFKGSRVKVELALAKGRDKGDRRHADKEKADRKRMRDATQEHMNRRR